MPFSRGIKDEARFRSRRRCCVCHKFCRRNIEVHHIVPEADGGGNVIENAIALCFDCHADVGHYNPRHPRGARFSPEELTRFRNDWWSRCAKETAADARLGDGVLELPPLSAGLDIVEREVGTLWSHLINEEERIEVVRFRGALIIKHHRADASGPHWYELYQVPKRQFLVYYKHIYRGDYCRATLIGACSWPDIHRPMSIAELQEKFPALATQAGLPRQHVLKL